MTQAPVTCQSEAWQCNGVVSAGEPSGHGSGYAEDLVLPLRHYIKEQGIRIVFFNSRTYFNYTFFNMKVTWQRLIRFVSTDGRILRGEPIFPSPDFDVGITTEETQLKARVIQGDDIYDETGTTRVTDEVVTVKTLLGPLAPTDVPILRCVGLNYATHSTSTPAGSWNMLFSEVIDTSNSPIVREAGRKVPPFPSIFFKPSTTVTDHGVNVVIPKIAQDDQADYEGELVSQAAVIKAFDIDISRSLSSGKMPRTSKKAKLWSTSPLTRQETTFRHANGSEIQIVPVVSLNGASQRASTRLHL